jgi:PAS domain S-box-containing protein
MALLAAFTASLALAQERVYRVVIDRENEPYEFVDERGQAQGYTAALLRAIGKAAGVRFEFVPLTWTEASAALDSGAADLISTIKVPERTALYEFSAAHSRFSHAIFRHRKAGGVVGLAALAGHRLGLQQPEEQQRLAERLHSPGWIEQNSFVLLALGGGLAGTLLLVLAWNRTLSRRVSAAMASQLESQERHRTMLETAMDGFWLADAHGRLLEVNATYCRMSGYSAQELLAMRIADLEADETAAHIRKVIAQGEDRFESRHRRKDGSVFDVEISAQYSPAAGGRFMVFVQDITERKLAQAAVQASLLEKVALLKEVHHRVKNNLQVIASLLRLEGRRSTVHDTQAVLADMQGRIHSMALLHEALYRSDRLAGVDLGGYLTQLANQAFRSLAMQSGAVRLDLEVTSVQVGMDLGLPCGLLVNELISNSLKHGFPDGRSGVVRVELLGLGDTTLLRLRVSDTGVGLPADFEARRGHSLGLQLACDLAEQIGGKLEIGPGPGAAMTVTFRADLSKPAETHA